MTPHGITVLVAGGKDYFNGKLVYEVLDSLHQTNPIGLLVNGGDLTGPDMSSHAWCRDRRVKECRRRNNGQAIAKNPDFLVVFPGGKDTANMVRRARTAGIPIIFAEKLECP